MRVEMEPAVRVEDPLVEEPRGREGKDEEVGWEEDEGDGETTQERRRGDGGEGRGEGGKDGERKMRG